MTSRSLKPTSLPYQDKHTILNSRGNINPTTSRDSQHNKKLETNLQLIIPQDSHSSFQIANILLTFIIMLI